MDKLSIFYNGILKEASCGRVHLYAPYNIIFNTLILEDNIKIESKVEYEDVIIPTLIIDNKELFNSLLEEYVSKALLFYDEENYPNENILKEKFIMTVLWSNATFDDFANPIPFLKKQINYLDNWNTYNHGVISKEQGIIMRLTKNSVTDKSPYNLLIELNYNHMIIPIANISVGIDNNSINIYSINSMSESHIKDDNIVNSILNYLTTRGIKNVEIPSFLITRWNSLIIKSFYSSNSDLQREKKISMGEKKLCVNVNEFFIQLSNYLQNQDNIEITANPLDIDFKLHLKLTTNSK